MPVVCVYVCLSVCLLATSCKNYWTDLSEKLTSDVYVEKEELVKFYKSFASESGSGSRKFFERFFNIAAICCSKMSSK